MNWFKHLAGLQEVFTMQAVEYVVKVLKTATETLITGLGALRQIATENGFKKAEPGKPFDPANMVEANIGDITGIDEIEAYQEARARVVAYMQGSARNANGYTPYNGDYDLRGLIAKELLDNLSLPESTEGWRTQTGETVADLVALASGSVGCTGAILSHLKYHRGLEGRTTCRNIATDRTHYWKHRDVAEDFGVHKTYEFMTEINGKLELKPNAVNEFGKDGGGVMVLNFGNPATFLPSEDSQDAFIEAIKRWNAAHKDSVITVVIDGPYDAFDGKEGYSFPSKMLRSGIPTTYSEAMTKKQFATGSRRGVVISNAPELRHFFTQFKYAMIGSESTSEQLVEKEVRKGDLHAKYQAQQKLRMEDVQARKEYFWSKLAQAKETARVQSQTELEKALDAIIRRTSLFYRPQGAFYLFLNFEPIIGNTDGLIEDSNKLGDEFAKKGVILVPGSYFGTDPNQPEGFNKTCMRMSFGKFDKESWQKQIDRVVDVIVEIVAESSAKL